MDTEYDEFNDVMQDRMLAIDTGKKLIERLKLRIHLSQVSVIGKTDFENNELEILKIKTVQELSKLEPHINDVEKRFIDAYKYKTGKTA
jgi:hypothetical protein